ncbi:MAG: hypothetical protein QOH12_1018 [Solirubrobacteraceae bacterium]|jgi:hypothetical protein|nr:hypothetical protein [Solirubrobacteraceae bacterium]
MRPRWLQLPGERGRLLLGFVRRPQGPHGKRTPRLRVRSPGLPRRDGDRLTRRSDIGGPRVSGLRDRPRGHRGLLRSSLWRIGSTTPKVGPNYYLPVLGRTDRPVNHEITESGQGDSLAKLLAGLRQLLSEETSTTPPPLPRIAPTPRRPIRRACSEKSTAPPERPRTRRRPQSPILDRRWPPAL